MNETKSMANMSTGFSLLVADYLIANGGGRLTPLQVIKLAYISHGYTLALLDHSLVPDEIEAWRYGPVIPSLYNFLKPYGGSPITRLLYCGTEVAADSVRERKEFFRRVFTDELNVILDRVLEVYGPLTGIELLRLTHKKGSPWSRYYKKGKRGIVIPNDVIKDHYKGLLVTNS